MLDFAGADAERQGPERAVGAGVTVAANDRQAGQRQPQLGANDVDDPLMAALDVVEHHAELSAILPEGFDLPSREGIADVELVFGRHVMIDRGDGQFGSADLAVRQSEPFKSLGAGDFVNKVTVHVRRSQALHPVAVTTCRSQIF